ncbi:eukaryotic aspartyl protease family protein [Striga asiatica]|uniref:Eukaryotic aspartyl protease family protein n=1 Tax=Striga asiatica TaxID=4170 RepID=A0A5A7P8U4_STRAF|nr:eukaryotic aspartyl protease family protein [Striga asiatica]
MMAISSKARATIYAPPINETLDANKIRLPVDKNDLRYSVKIKIGSPGTEMTLLLDTASGPIWTQCKKSRSLFFPGKSHFFTDRSKTYRVLPCNHPMCQMDDNMCTCKNKLCVCTVKYGIRGGKTTRVDYILSSDSFTLPLRNKSSTTFTNMIFGCADRSNIFSGILGLNMEPYSLIKQLGENAKGRYSYCLHQGHGLLRFGDDIPQVTKYYKTTKILNPLTDEMYVGLTDISVAGKRLGLSPGMVSDVNNGGILMDTGTRFTVLKRRAYETVTQAFASYYDGMLKRVKVPRWGLCYKRNSSMKSNVSMTFHLQGADYVTSDMFVDLLGGSVMCLALQESDVPILGAVQQLNKRFIFDTNKNVMMFADEDCAKDRG